MDSNVGIKRKVEEGEGETRFESHNWRERYKVEQSRRSDPWKLQDKGASEIIRINCGFERPDFLRLPSGLHYSSFPGWISFKHLRRAT